MTTPLDRRLFCSLAGATAFSLAIPGQAQSAARGTLGNQLYGDVVRYASFGHHRTAGEGDEATTTWLSERLAKAGYEVSSPSFEVDTFEPSACTVRVGGRSIVGFPAWPVVPTCGTAGLLRNAAQPGDLTGHVALVVLPYRPGSAFIVRGFGSAVLDAQSRGARAIVVVTKGPTGEIIALNAHLTRFAWKVPVILVAGKEAAALEAAAAELLLAAVAIEGVARPRARATNVLAIRAAAAGAPPGTIVLTTPKSGWFTCAGERGSGIAIFLYIAEMLARHSRHKLLCVATSGHELEGLGGEVLLKEHAPAPPEVALWVHVGANIASNDVDLSGQPRRLDTLFTQRGILVPAGLIGAASLAFRGQPGYQQPVDILSDAAVGEVVIYRREGYRNLVGLVGAHPLHHTQLDTPELVTSPAAIAPVAESLWKLVGPLSR